MALRKDPARRYASVAQFSEDIRRHLDGLPVIARKDTFTYRASKFIARHKIGVAATVLVFLAIIAGLTVSVWQARVAARERDQARHEKVKADQLNEFLQNILSAASPEQKGRDAKVIEVLKDAAEHINTEFATQPDLKAQALLTIGATYLQLGLIDEAEKALAEALTINSGLHGERNVATTASMIGLAEAFMAKARYDDAEKLLRKAIAIERNLSRSGSKTLALGLFMLGELQVRKGEQEAAKSTLEESLAIFEKIAGENNEDFAFTLISLGRAYQFSGDWSSAEATYRKSIGIFRTLPPRYEIRMATTLLNLGDLLTTQGRYEEGINALREADRIFQKQGDTDLPLFLEDVSLQSILEKRRL